MEEGFVLYPIQIFAMNLLLEDSVHPATGHLFNMLQISLVPVS